MLHVLCVVGVRTGDPLMNIVEKRMGVRLKEIRSAKGMSIAMLSRSTGIDRSYLSRLENYGGNISVVQLSRLCLVLEVNLREFFSADLFGELSASDLEDSEA